MSTWLIPGRKPVPTAHSPVVSFRSSLSHSLPLILHLHCRVRLHGRKLLLPIRARQSDKTDRSRLRLFFWLPTHHSLTHSLTLSLYVSSSRDRCSFHSTPSFHSVLFHPPLLTCWFVCLSVIFRPHSPSSPAGCCGRPSASAWMEVPPSLPSLRGPCPFTKGTRWTEDGCRGTRPHSGPRITSGSLLAFPLVPFIACCVNRHPEANPLLGSRPSDRALKKLLSRRK